MITGTLILENIPVGLIPDIKDKISLVGQISQEIYYNRTSGCVDAMDVYISKNKPDDNWEQVKCILCYDIEAEIEQAFQTFMLNYVNRITTDYNQLNNSWSLKNDQCK